MNQRENESLVVGIAGGTGSGKTTLAYALQKQLGDEHSVIISQDAYYKDRSDSLIEDRMHVNYDHPDALELSLLAEHLRALKSGKIIMVPVYDFPSHTRKHDGVLTASRSVIIVEGILLFAEPLVREACDIKVFVETADDIRFVRRLLRDIAERGRTAESVAEQYLNTVRPMHKQFVENGAKVADLVVDGEAHLEEGVETVMRVIRSRGLDFP
ncbi:uridine kinase [Pontiellaceae bacterium B12227]|nr:uridine kinase [Pontiellaceae bacterium B12227]